MPAGANEKLTALLAGGSGLTGSALHKLLDADPRFSDVITVGRSGSRYGLDWLNTPVLTGPIPDVAYCCLGTTIKKAGSQENFRKVDQHLVVTFARACTELGIPRLIILSSLGASPASGNFYLRVKGEMEDQVQEVFSGKLAFLRPSLLIGKRQESRPGERTGQLLMKILDPLFRIPWLERWRAVEAVKVARAMIGLTFPEWVGTKRVENREILALSRHPDRIS